MTTPLTLSSATRLATAWPVGRDVVDGTTGIRYLGNGSTPGGIPAPYPYVISQSGASNALTGTTAETVFTTFNVPANFMGNNGSLRVRALVSWPNSANAKTVRMRIYNAGGSPGTIIGTVGATTTQEAHILFWFQNTNASNAQVASGAASYTTTTAAILTAAIDTTQIFTVALTGQLALGTETMTLLGYTAELMYST